MLPRDRDRRLLDPGSPFLEFASSRAKACTRACRRARSIITGVGMVSGRACMIIANDATVKGGTYYGITCKKHVRAQRFAWQHRLPCITLVTAAARSARPGEYLSRTRASSAASSTTSADVGRTASRRSRSFSGLHGRAAPTCRRSVRRNRDRARAGRDVPRRARSSSRPRPRRGRSTEALGGARDAQPRQRRDRPPGRERRPRHRDRARHRWRDLPRCRRHWTRSLAPRAPERPDRHLRPRPARPSEAPTVKRDILRACSTPANFGVQGAVGRHAPHRLRPHRRLAMGMLANKGVLFSTAR